MTKYGIARKIGLTPTHVINILNHKEYASLPTALKIEKATGGEIKVEQIVRPEVAQALREYLFLRCPMLSKTSHSKEEEKSLRSKEE